MIEKVAYKYLYRMRKQYNLKVIGNMYKGLFDMKLKSDKESQKNFLNNKLLA